MDKLTAIKIKNDDGTYSDEIPVSVLSENVEWDSTHTLVDVLGSINVDVTGTIQDQISQLFNKKVSNSDMQAYVTNSMPTYITNWLNTNVNPVGSVVVVDSSLTVSGAAADAKVTGDAIRANTDDINDLKEDLGITEYPFTEGGYITTVSVGNTASSTPVSEASYCYALIPCVEGQKFFITATTDGNSGRSVYDFTDTNLKVLFRYNASATLSEYEVTATNDGYLIVNSYISSDHRVVSRVDYADEIKENRQAISDLSDTVDSISESTTSISRQVLVLTDAVESTSKTEQTYFNLSDWRNGYIRDSAPIGSVGEAHTALVCGYNSPYCVLKGDGNTYNIAVDSGWKLRLGKYANNVLGSFIEYVDTSSEKVTLSKSHYYIFEIEKDPLEVITPSDVTATTIVLSETKYSPLLSEEIHSYNWCNPDDITANSGTYLGVNGVKDVGTQYSYTGFIPVSAGDKVYILRDGMIRTNARFRYVTAYDADKAVLPNSGESTAGKIYTVPAGVAFVRVTVFLDDYNLGNYAININKIMPYDEYGEETLPTGVGENKNDILLLNNMPLSTMPEYIVKALAYRPLSTPKKGYICLVTDDGKEGMVSYTIPMVINKSVPCTFAVMSESECFATSERTQAVVDAVNNHGCAISQHGGRNWTEYSEYGLNKFFEEETAFFTSIGLTAKSAVTPSHYTTPLVQAVAGGRYGVVRSGYRGYNADGVYGGTVHNYYDYYTSGEGSNLFGLSSYNFSGRSLADNQLAIDYAYANNKIMIVYWHENALTDATKAVMEQSIDYAKAKGLEFITLDQIPYLNEWIATF